MRKLSNVLQSSGRKTTSIETLNLVRHKLDAILKDTPLTTLDGRPVITGVDAMIDTILRLSPFVTVKTSKRGGANVKIPTLLHGLRSCSLGIRLLVDGAIHRAKNNGMPLGHALLMETLSVLDNGNASSLARARMIIKEAKANRMFRPRSYDGKTSTSSSTSTTTTFVPTDMSITEIAIEELKTATKADLEIYDYNYLGPIPPATK